MDGPNFVYHREETVDLDGYVEDRDRTITFKVENEELYIEIYGEEIDENCDPVNFYKYIAIPMAEARQLRDFLNANVKD